MIVQTLVKWISCRGCLKEMKRPLNCGSCGLLQRQQDIRASLNYFSLFAVPITYTVDQRHIEREKQKLQFDIHPDKWRDGLKEEAQQLSALVNVAAQVLKHPIKRGEYILELYQQPCQDETLPDHVLQQILQFESALVEADQALLQKMSKQLTQKMKGLKAQADSCFKAKDWKGLGLALSLMRFYMRIGTERHFDV